MQSNIDWPSRQAHISMLLRQVAMYVMMYEKVSATFAERKIRHAGLPSELVKGNVSGRYSK
jgi:hypothetical protein